MHGAAGAALVAEIIATAAIANAVLVEYFIMNSLKMMKDKFKNRAEWQDARFLYQSASSCESSKREIEPTLHWPIQ